MRLLAPGAPFINFDLRWVACLVAWLSQTTSSHSAARMYALRQVHRWRIRTPSSIQQSSAALPLVCTWQVRRDYARNGRPSSGGWDGPAKLLGRLMGHVAATMEEGQPGQSEAGAGGSSLLRPEDCVRVVEAFLPRGPGLAGPAVRAHRAAYGHVVCALLRLAGAALRGSLPGAPGPGTPGGSGGAQRGGEAGPEACGARAAVALCKTLAAAFRWLLSGQRGPEVPAEGEEVRWRVVRAAEAASIQLWGSVKEHGAYLDPPTWIHAGMRPCSCLRRFPH